MLRSERRLVDPQRSLDRDQLLLVVAGETLANAEVVERDAERRMIGAERLLLGLDHALLVLDRLEVLAEARVRRAEIDDGLEHVGVVGAERALPDGETVLPVLSRLLEVLLEHVNDADIVEQLAAQLVGVAGLADRGGREIDEARGLLDASADQAYRDEQLARRLRDEYVIARVTGRPERLAHGGLCGVLLASEPKQPALEIERLGLQRLVRDGVGLDDRPGGSGRGLLVAPGVLHRFDLAERRAQGGDLLAHA